MPSKSAKQAKLMRAVAHNPKFARKVGIPQSVGRDFAAADKRTGRYAKGGKILRTKGIIDRLIQLGRDFSDSDDVIGNRPEYLANLQKADWGRDLTPSQARFIVDDFDNWPRWLNKYQISWEDPSFRGLDVPRFSASRKIPQIFSADEELAEMYANSGPNDEGLLMRLLPTRENLLLPNPWKSESELILAPRRKLIQKGKPTSRDMDFDRIDVEQRKPDRYARGGSVLGALAKPRMRPVAAVKSPAEMLRSADAAIAGAAGKIRKMKGS